MMTSRRRIDCYRRPIYRFDYVFSFAVGLNNIFSKTTISHIQYIIFYGTGFDKKVLAIKHHLLESN